MCVIKGLYCTLPNILIVLGTLPDKRFLSNSMCHYQVMMKLHFLNGFANDADSTQKLKIASLLLV